MIKRCTKCGEAKALDEFRLRPGGVTTRCRACLQVDDRERYAKNREKQVARVRAYREANRDTVRETNRKHHLKHRDRRNSQSKAWRESNRERFLAAKKIYRQKNADKIKAALKKWRDENREHILEYRQEHASEIRTWLRRRRAERGSKYLIAKAKDTISQSVGIPFRLVPLDLAEAKAAQLAVVRITRRGLPS